MMKRTLPFLVLTCLISCSLRAQVEPHSATKSSPANLPAPALGQKLHINGVPNAGKLNTVLYRGAQPRKAGLVELKKMGITTIVDLRGEDKSKTQRERKEAEELGMRFVNIPVSGWSPPTNEQVAEFLGLFRGDPKERVFVHCRFGDDRTGVFVATYRMAFDKWSDEQAMKEMYFFGFNGFWHPAMKTFVREFPARLKNSPPLAPLQLQGPPS